MFIVFKDLTDTHSLFQTWCMLSVCLFFRSRITRMSKKQPGSEVFQMKITRNDRFAQMSHQEKLIEQKKREIQAKLEQRQKCATPTEGKAAASSSGQDKRYHPHLSKVHFTRLKPQQTKNSRAAFVFYLYFFLL